MSSGTFQATNDTCSKLYPTSTYPSWRLKRWAWFPLTGTHTLFLSSGHQGKRIICQWTEPVQSLLPLYRLQSVLVSLTFLITCFKGRQLVMFYTSSLSQRFKSSLLVRHGLYTTSFFTRDKKRLKATVNFPLSVHDRIELGGRTQVFCEVFTVRLSLPNRFHHFCGWRYCCVFHSYFEICGQRICLFI